MADTDKNLQKRLDALMEALQVCEACCRGIFEKSADGIVIIEENGSILLLNPEAARLFGRPAEELLGRPFGYPVVAGDKTELEVFLREGGRTVVDMRVTEIEWQGKGSFLATLRDVTDRRLAEERLLRSQEELERSNKDLEQFAHSVSHDLKAPLRSIAGFAQVLAEDYKGRLDDEANGHVVRIMNSAKRMQRMIDDVLAYSRVGRTGEREAVSFESIFKQATENLSAGIAETGAVITQDPLPTARAVQTQMIMLFQNLIGNAIKFCVQAPRVHVSAARKGNFWEFSVRDNGIGIKSEHFERLFTLFQRLHPEHEFPGSGVGLAVCKKIVEGHGGAIRLESEPGKGTTFYFTLPAAT